MPCGASARISALLRLHVRSSESARSSEIPVCQTPLGLSTCSVFGRALHRQPRLGSPQPQGKVLIFHLLRGWQNTVEIIQLEISNPMKPYLSVFHAGHIHCNLNVLDLWTIISGGAVYLCGPYVRRSPPPCRPSRDFEISTSTMSTVLCQPLNSMTTMHTYAYICMYLYIYIYIYIHI